MAAPVTANIVCVAPHPDDAELCCGGLLLKAKRAGMSIGIIDCTRGELGTRGSVATRARESAKADALLGTDVRLNLKLKDGGLSDDHALYRALVPALRRLRPRLVLAPYWEDQHPDHEAVGRAIHKAAWLCGAPKFEPKSARGVTAVDRLPYRPEVILHYQSRFGIDPELIVDISEVFEDKLALARCYASQFGPAAPKQKKGAEPMTKLSSQAFVDWFSSMHGFYGAKVGVSFGEPYCMKAPLPVRSLGGLFAGLFGN